MKTAMVNGKRVNISFRTSTGVSTQFYQPGGKRPGLYGADIYNIDEDDNHLVIVGTNGRNWADVLPTVTVITKTHYERLAAEHDPYNNMKFHIAVMRWIGFE